MEEKLEVEPRVTPTFRSADKRKEQQWRSGEGGKLSGVCYVQVQDPVLILWGMSPTLAWVYMGSLATFCVLNTTYLESLNEATSLNLIPCAT